MLPIDYMEQQQQVATCLLLTCSRAKLACSIIIARVWRVVWLFDLWSLASSANIGGGGGGAAGVAAAVRRPEAAGSQESDLISCVSVRRANEQPTGWLANASSY